MQQSSLQIIVFFGHLEFEAENYDYNRDRGFDRIIERAFPIKAVFERSQIL